MKTTRNILSKFDWKVIKQTRNIERIMCICRHFFPFFSNEMSSALADSMIKWWASDWNVHHLYVFQMLSLTNESKRLLIIPSYQMMIACFYLFETNELIKMRICRKWHALFDQPEHNNNNKNAVFCLFVWFFMSHIAFIHSLSMINSTVNFLRSFTNHNFRVYAHAHTHTNFLTDWIRTDTNNKWNA